MHAPWIGGSLRGHQLQGPASGRAWQDSASRLLSRALMREAEAWGARPPEGSLPDVHAQRPHPRFREEMYGDLGHLVWSFFVFLWRFVTLLGLLLLLTMCLMSLYRSPPPHYIAWNSTLVKLPHPALPPPLWGPSVRSPAPTGL